MGIFNREKSRNAIIIGCGRIGMKIAALLDSQNYNVSIIDIDEQAFSGLPDSSRFCLVEGDATDMDTLECAGIKGADVILITTGDDNTNIMIAEIAKEYYQVHEVIMRVEDISKEQVYKEMGIRVISPMILLLDEVRLVLANERGA
ncbi:MAG: potassium channel family protein [Saccharofermentanales bacterium]